MLVDIARNLSTEVGKLHFGAPVTHVYNPLEYAFETHRAYLERFGRAPKEVVFFGMNPGPFGMAQTGVPFGEVAHVRDWLGIEGEVEQPKSPHPARPVEGFKCKRSEVSGARLWGFFRTYCGTPDVFSRRFFVANYCPLVFMEDSGRNRTPDKLPANEREPLYRACDAALRATVEHLAPRWVIGVGAFAEARAKSTLTGMPVQIGRIAHPSPASPAANRGWAQSTLAELEKLGISLRSN